MNWQKNGFIQRSRQITGSNFVKALLFAWLQNHSPSIDGIARAGYRHGLRISAPGLAVLTGLWRRPHRSLVKGCQMIKEQSARLAH
jgi:hypothetical protein